MRHGSLENRLIANSVLDPATGCWVWCAKFAPRRGGCKDGRLNLRIEGRHVTRRAHRVAYEVFKAPIPKGYEVDHVCVNSCCINPAHLEAVKPRENIKRRDKRRKGVSV